MNNKSAFLESMAKKYIWWQSPDESIHFPQKIIAQVMNIGTFEDLEELTQLTDKQELIDILQNAKSSYAKN